MASWIKWQNHNIADVEVELLLQALKQRYGYDFTGYARASLKRRLCELTNFFEVQHLSELIPMLLYDEAVAQTVVNNISVRTSDFFRDAEIWAQLRNQVLPQLESFPWINIWQAGCGYGEETYSLVILLHEAGLLNRSRIFVSDINSEFLQQSQQGSWNHQRWPLWEKNYQLSGGVQNFADYFELHGEQYQFHHKFKTQLQFLEHNLVTDDVFKEVQWVVCRNVLIYFGDDLQTRVLQLLTRSLERGGFLWLGRAEQIFDTTHLHHELSALPFCSGLYRKNINRGN